MEDPRHRPLVIRADANTAIGTGHLMRCVALGQHWQDAGGRVCFVTCCDNQSLLHRLNAEHFDVHPVARTYPDAADREATRHVLEQYPGACVAVDGYHFDGGYQQAITQAGNRLLVIDDMAHVSHYYADIVLNQNLNAERLHYSCEPQTILLLGTRYVLLRREFLAWTEWKRRTPEVALRILVTLGGSDPHNCTGRIIAALSGVGIPGLEAVVVVGAGNPHLTALETAVQQSRAPIRLVRNPQSMPELMAWADLAVSAAGSTCWELLFMGLTSLVVVLADNQRAVARELDRSHLAVNLGWYEGIESEAVCGELGRLIKSPEVRSETARRGREIVDGEGAHRVLTCLRGDRLRLRPVREEDCRLLYDWANDPETRRMSFTTDPILWETHARWFSGKLHDPHCRIYVGLDSGDSPVGQIRFDIVGDGQAEVDVTVDRVRRGAGYGTSLIAAGVRKLFREAPVRTVHAFIKPGNEPSVRAFLKAGFARAEGPCIKGNTAVHFVRENANET